MKFYSARQAIHDAYAIHLRSKGFEINPVSFRSANGSQKQNNDQRICNAVEAGKIIAAVESLEEPFRSWAKWAYGPRTQEFLPEQAKFFQWLEQDVNQRLASSEREYRDTTLQRIRDVVAYTVLDYRGYAVNERHLYTASLIIRKCRIQRQNWRRDFERWWEVYWDQCDRNLDYACLTKVSASIVELNSGRMRK